MSETRRPDRAVMATGEGERVGDWQTEAATSRSAPPDGEAATPDALGVALDRVLQVTTDLARAMAQAAGILGFKMMDLKPADGTLYYFVGSDKLRFRQPVLPGDQLILEAKFLSCKRSIWKFECQATVDGKPVCSAEIICAERKL